MKEKDGMMSMREGYKTRHSDRDIEILLAVYHLQAILMGDIEDTYYGGRKKGREKLQQQCDRGYLERRHIPNKKRGGSFSVYEIKEKGIELLFNLGKIEQKRRARDLSLPRVEMADRVEISKVAINLTQSGWSFLGSSDGKKEEELPNTSLMQCLLTSPEKRNYQVYIVHESITENKLTKLIQELTSNKNGSLVLYKARFAEDETPAYKAIVKEFTESHLAINELCLIPLVELEQGGEKINLTMQMLKHSGAEKVKKYLQRQYGKVRYSDNRYGFGDMVVEQIGGDYDICNYLRRDRSALRLLAENLTRSEYQNVGKGAIVLTWNGFVKEAQQIIDGYQKRDFIQVKGLTIRDIIDSQ